MPPSTSLPLVVDADGTLLRGDMLHEALRCCLLQPKRWLPALAAAWRGRLALKQHLASWVVFESGMLVPRAEVIEYIRAQRAAGVRDATCSFPSGCRDQPLFRLKSMSTSRCFDRWIAVSPP